jgi:hypothetical protein
MSLISSLANEDGRIKTVLYSDKGKRTVIVTNLRSCPVNTFDVEHLRKRTDEARYIQGHRDTPVQASLF